MDYMHVVVYGIGLVFHLIVQTILYFKAKKLVCKNCGQQIDVPLLTDVELQKIVDLVVLLKGDKKDANR